MAKFEEFVTDVNPMTVLDRGMAPAGSHEWRLARMLEAASMPESAEGKRVIDRMLETEAFILGNNVRDVPRYLADVQVEAFKQRRELLKTEAIESTNLVPTEYQATLLEGAEPNKVVRQMLGTIPLTSNDKTIPVGDTGGVLPKASEAGELKQREQAYSKVSFSTVKYGAADFISSELIEDGLFDIVAAEVKKIGARGENTLNEVTLQTILDGAGKEHDTAGSDQGIKAIVTARRVMKKAGFNPTSLLMSAEFEGGVAAEGTTFGQYFGSLGGGSSFVTTGQIPRILGMAPYQYDPLDGTYNSSTYTWDYGADGEMGAVLMDLNQQGAFIGMRRDISVKKFDDPVRDIVGATVTMRFDVEVATNLDDGICRVEY
ncbi:phage major capsid protein [Methanococcoides sp. FTZ1]|uniref:phage major capsid protein n=1 Tax=Methanococcoides sp. FTZ1 TaxID=3439061 RepID=UPI003F82B062